MAEGMSLGDFIKRLAAMLHARGVAMPFKNQGPWHLVLFDLKMDSGSVGRPAFLDKLTFDWDGPHPRSRELSEFLNALHWNASVSASNPHYESIELSDDVARLWLAKRQHLDRDTEVFINKAVESAETEFSKALDARAGDVASAAGRGVSSAFSAR